MVAYNGEELAGQHVGHYELMSHVADHQVSDLFLARDIKLDQSVYLERLRSTVEEDPELAAQFQRRMELFQQIRHDNLAIIIDVDVTEDGYPYAAMEYFDGRSVADVVDDLNRYDDLMPAIGALELSKGMTLGLSAIHAAEYVHHSPRPQSILVREDDTPVIMDAGVPVAKGSTNPALGSADLDILGYESPEELEGNPLTRRSNIYSLGIILYETLAGHRPTLPTMTFDIFPQSDLPKETPLEDVRPDLAGETYRLVRNCLWRQEWSRFETTDEMLTSIETAIFAEQDLPKAAAWTPGRSRSLVYLLPLALIVLLGAGFFLVRSIRGNATAETPPPTRASETVTEEGAGGGLIAVGETPDPEVTAIASPTASPTFEIPTQAPFDVSISVLAPAANREFGPDDTINFDWFWPTLPVDGQHFVVSLFDQESEYILDELTEPNNGAAYRVRMAVDDLPTTAEELRWQVRLEEIANGEVVVSSDEVPIFILAPAPTATSTPTETPIPTPTATATSAACVILPPPGWAIYVVRQGDALAGLAQRANVPIRTLMRVNCLENDLLSVGRQLWLPALLQPTATTASAAPPPTSTPDDGDDGGSNPPPPTSTPVPDPATSTPEPDPPTATAPPP